MQDIQFGAMFSHVLLCFVPLFVCYRKTANVAPSWVPGGRRQGWVVLVTIFNNTVTSSIGPMLHKNTGKYFSVSVNIFLAHVANKYEPQHYDYPMCVRETQHIIYRPHNNRHGFHDHQAEGLMFNISRLNTSFSRPLPRATRTIEK